jgi:hypothetical protein
MRLTLVLLFLLINLPFQSQTIIWSEDFDNNGGSGSNWGTLNQNVGAQGPTANLWYISCKENGNAAGACGTGCGTDKTLHVGSSNAGDIGAAYEIGCMPGCIWCDMLSICINSTTNKRSQSLNINTTGHTGLTLNFNYIELGQGTIDDCIVEYSINGGASWLTLVNTPKPPLGGCAPQGLWTAYSIALPVSCENISNLRIAFRWQNNADGVGSDPSFAVDDITITKPIVLPITLLSFNALKQNNNVVMEWVTETEINNDFFTVERSTDSHEFFPIIKTKGASNSNTNKYYTETDYNIPQQKTLYYRLKQTDYDGKYSYSDIIPVNNNSLAYDLNYSNNLLKINSENSRAQVKIYDIMGKEVYSNSLINNHEINTAKFKPGIYIVKVGTSENLLVRKIKF